MINLFLQDLMEMQNIVLDVLYFLDMTFCRIKKMG